MSTDSTVVLSARIPSPDTFSTTMPAEIPLVELTVIVATFATNVVEIFSCLLGAHLPSLNADSAKSCPPFVASLRSNV